MHASAPSVIESPGPSKLGRMLRSKLVRRAAVAGLLVALIVAACWYFPRSIVLLTPLAPAESFANGTAVYLDDAAVGEVAAMRVMDGANVIELRLSRLSAGQKRQLREGLVRVTGYRMVWLTSEFVDKSEPPLIDGDTVPAISRAERESRRFMAQFLTWVLPGSGVGLLWIAWRATKRFFS